MKQIYTKVLIFAGMLGMLLMPNSTNVLAATGDGIEFRVAYAEGRYAVYMRPTVDATGPALTLTSQVTLKVPHASGADRFDVQDLRNGVDGTEWTQTSRIDAPAEDINADYLSFTVAFPAGNHQAFTWRANEEILVFSFANHGACQGGVTLLSNDDPFTSDVANGVVNSANTNPGNQIDVLNLGEGNLYLGNYGSVAHCADRTIELKNFFYLPLINR